MNELVESYEEQRNCAPQTPHPQALPRLRQSPLQKTLQHNENMNM